MRAVVWHGVGDIRIDGVPDPKVQQPTDAVVRLTASAICGTDLHFVRGTMAGMREGTILGHEGVGVIEETGPGVRNLRPGDRGGPAADEASDDPSAQALRWAVEGVAKAGTVGIIGVYPPQFEQFPIGQAMNKNLTLKMGNCNHRRYIPDLVTMTRAGAVDPSNLLTQVSDVGDAIEAYQAFDREDPGWIKVALDPRA